MGNLLPSFQRIARIQLAVAESYGIDPAWMKKAGRNRSFAHPRQVAMYLARDITGKSLSSIASLFGGYDHTTVLHAVRAVEKRMESVPFYRDDVEALRERCLAQ